MKRPPKKLPVALTEEEYISIMKNTKKDIHRLAFMFAYESGMRISEVLNLEPRDIMENQILIRQGKGSKDRVVPRPKHLKKRHIDLLPIKFKNYESGARSLQIGFKLACKKAGVLETKPDAHFHSLRHSFATRCIERGMGIHHVKTLLGHSSISTTNVYLVANPKESLKLYEELF